MKTIEIRRHSIRNKPGVHLNQDGVQLARNVGENLGIFDRVVTSTHARAFETAIAMGYAVDEQFVLMSDYPGAVGREIIGMSDFWQFAKAVKRKGSAARQYADELLKIYQNLLDYLADGRAALVINHGGVLELSAVAALPNADHEAWGAGFDHCEGIRLFWEDGKFVDGEILRVPK